MDEQENKSIRASGLECPHCGCPESSVYQVRHYKHRHRGKTVSKTVRTRICECCRRRFRSTERTES